MVCVSCFADTNQSSSSPAQPEWLSSRCWYGPTRFWALNWFRCCTARSWPLRSHISRIFMRRWNGASISRSPDRREAPFWLDDFWAAWWLSSWCPITLWTISNWCIYRWDVSCCFMRVKERIREMVEGATTRFQSTHSESSPAEDRILSLIQ